MRSIVALWLWDTDSSIGVGRSGRIELVDWSGRQKHRAERDAIAASKPRALTQCGLHPRRWTHQVRGVGKGYRRVTRTAQELMDQAICLGQQWPSLRRSLLRSLTVGQKAVAPACRADDSGAVYDVYVC